MISIFKTHVNRHHQLLIRSVRTLMKLRYTLELVLKIRNNRKNIFEKTKNVKNKDKSKKNTLRGQKNAR